MSSSNLSLHDVYDSSVVHCCCETSSTPAVWCIHHQILILLMWYLWEILAHQQVYSFAKLSSPEQHHSEDKLCKLLFIIQFIILHNDSSVLLYKKSSSWSLHSPAVLTSHTSEVVTSPLLLIVSAMYTNNYQLFIRCDHTSLLLIFIAVLQETCSTQLTYAVYHHKDTVNHDHRDVSSCLLVMTPLFSTILYHRLLSCNISKMTFQESNLKTFNFILARDFCCNHRTADIFSSRFLHLLQELF